MMEAEERARRLVYNVANSLAVETPTGPRLEKATKGTLWHVREIQREAEAKTIERCALIVKRRFDDHSTARISAGLIPTAPETIILTQVEAEIRALPSEY